MGKLKYTDSELVADSLKFISRGEWQVKSKERYLSAYARGILDQCCGHMIPLVEVKWTLDVCKAKGKKYGTGVNWKDNCPNSYAKASRRKWLHLCLSKKDLKANLQEK